MKVFKLKGRKIPEFEILKEHPKWVKIRKFQFIRIYSFKFYQNVKFCPKDKKYQMHYTLYNAKETHCPRCGMKMLTKAIVVPEYSIYTEYEGWETKYGLHRERYVGVPNYHSVEGHIDQCYQCNKHIPRNYMSRVEIRHRFVPYVCLDCLLKNPKYLQNALDRASLGIDD